MAFSEAVLTFLEDSTTSQFSAVNGFYLTDGADAIIGSGSVVIAGSTFFGSSTNFINNSFSGGLTLASGSLEIYSTTSLGSGAITGNGGTLVGENSAMTISNGFIFNGGTTTSFENADGFTLVGSISTSGSGSAGIFCSEGILILEPSSLTINQGSSFQTNGTSVTTSNISGAGGLILGYKQGVNTTTDTLTILGTGEIAYSGVISDNLSGGYGAVIIQAPVSFSGSNTFSEGLTLSSNASEGISNTSMLTIYAADNVGSGSIYGNGGGLATAIYTGTSDQTIPIHNDWIYTDNTTTILNVVSTLTTLELLGTNSTSTGSGTAYITKEGDGILYLSESSQFASGTYNLTVNKGNVTVDAEIDSTISYFLEDGILQGNQESFFALAEAAYRNWGVQPIYIDSNSELNLFIHPTSEGIYPSLRGNGSVSNVQVFENGVVAPGAPSKIGALEVASSIEFHSGSYLGIAINADSGSILIVDNIVVIDSSVAVTIAPESGLYLQTTHVILTAGLLEGRFAGFTIPNSYFLDGFLDYSVPNEVLLSIDPRKVVSLATGANAIAVANALDKVIIWNREHVSYQFDSAGGGSSLHPFIVSDTAPLLENVLASLLPLTTEEEMTDALNQLQPAFLKGFTIVQEDNIVKMRDSLSNRTDYILNTKGCFTFTEDKTCCAKDDKIMHVWISGMGDVLAQDSNTYADSPQVGYQSKMGGFAAGIDGNFAKVLYLGGIGGYTTSHLKWKENQGTGNINTGYAGLYLSAISDMFYGNLSVIGGFSDFSSKRNIKYTGVDLTASGKHSGKQLLSHADTGVNFTIGGFTIRPFDSFDYVTQTETAYTEKGAGEWDLSVDKVNAIFLRNELGLTLSTCLCFSNMKWVIAPKASWVREVRVKGDTFKASFAEAAPADAEFTVTGYFPDRSLFSPGVSLTGAMCQDRLTVQLNYNGAFMHGYSDHSYGGEVRYAF